MKLEIVIVSYGKSKEGIYLVQVIEKNKDLVYDNFG